MRRNRSGSWKEGWLKRNRSGSWKEGWLKRNRSGFWKDGWLKRNRSGFWKEGWLKRNRSGFWKEGWLKRMETESTPRPMLKIRPSVRGHGHSWASIMALAIRLSQIWLGHQQTQWMTSKSGAAEEPTSSTNVSLFSPLLFFLAGGSPPKETTHGGCPLVSLSKPHVAQISPQSTWGQGHSLLLLRLGQGPLPASRSDSFGFGDPEDVGLGAVRFQGPTGYP